MNSLIMMNQARSMIYRGAISKQERIRKESITIVRTIMNKVSCQINQEMSKAN